MIRINTAAVMLYGEYGMCDRLNKNIGDGQGVRMTQDAWQHDDDAVASSWSLSVSSCSHGTRSVPRPSRMPLRDAATQQRIRRAVL